MTNFYDILDQLRGKLLEHPSVNTVTTGNQTDIDLGKTTIFPLTHLIVKNATISDKLIEFNVLKFMWNYDCNRLPDGFKNEWPKIEDTSTNYNLTNKRNLALERTNSVKVDKMTFYSYSRLWNEKNIKQGIILMNMSFFPPLNRI